jgi:hypothetical protein
MIKRAIATMVCNFNVLLMVQSQAGFFFQLCEVHGLAIIYKRALPNFTAGQNPKSKELGIPLCSSGKLEANV